jgi:hypothetical protein
MQRVNQKAIARISRSSVRERATGLVEVAIFSLLGLAITLFLIAHNWFPALPLTFAQ